MPPTSIAADAGAYSCTQLTTVDSRSQQDHHTLARYRCRDALSPLSTAPPLSLFLAPTLGCGALSPQSSFHSTYFHPWKCCSVPAGFFSSSVGHAGPIGAREALCLSVEACVGLGILRMFHSFRGGGLARRIVDLLGRRLIFEDLRMLLLFLLLL